MKDLFVKSCFSMKKILFFLLLSTRKLKKYSQVENNSQIPDVRNDSVRNDSVSIHQRHAWHFHYTMS